MGWTIINEFKYIIFYVTRRTPETRQKAKEDIKTRSLSPDQELPQLFLCPEGTNTNRRVLIQFKVINGFEFPLQIAYIEWNAELYDNNI